MMKLFKIKSVKINEREQFMLIVVEANKFKFSSASEAIKFII